MNSSLIQILLVEDNPRDAELTLRALRKRNLANNVVHVQDGQEALDFLFGVGMHAGRDASAQPRLVMLDLKLPKIDGIEVLRQIRENPMTRLLPVVVMTSSREDRDVVEAYNLRVNSYIVKPVEFENFCEAVSNVGFYWLLLNQPPIL
jgi:CheY-like chemotaxis protein